MKKFILPVSIILVLILVGSLITACAGGGEIAKTVTVHPTIVDAPPVTVTPTFTVSFAPDIRHTGFEALLADFGGTLCFDCHGTVQNHELWVYDPFICDTCHNVVEYGD